MSVIVLVGAQWGDEGKGKVTDMLAESVDLVVRFQGGNNAGHTVMTDGKEYKLHLIPSGILYEHKTCVISDGLVIDLEVLIGEIDKLQTQGISCSNLRISHNAHLIMPYHRLMDVLEEDLKGKHKIGTTGRGIGPCYADKMSRIGLRVGDLYDIEEFRGRLGHALKYKNLILNGIFKHEGFKAEEIEAEYMEYAQRIEQYACDTSVILHDAVRSERVILFEGAQGTLLDIDHGTYPYVTSSHAVAGGACIGTGVGPRKIDRVIGVTKAYTTRVGEGPFPTELPDELGDPLRERGGEFGTTTGRPRRIGWLDALALKYAIRVNDMDTLAMTKLDVLDEMETIRICSAYKVNGKVIENFSTNPVVARMAEPVYEDVPGWGVDTSAMTSYDQLPSNLKKYLLAVEAILNRPISILSVGPNRAQTVILRKFV